MSARRSAGPAGIGSCGGPLTAGSYIRLRREAATYTLRDVAMLCAFGKADIDAAQQLLARAEIDAAVLDDAALTRLAEFVRFDREIYVALATDLPASPVCNGCGCSWHDPCRGAAGPCAWADPSATICTRCASRAAA